MRVLIFGADGQVGRALRDQLAHETDLSALTAASPDYCGDLQDLDGIAATIRELQPTVIINAAAYTAVDRAESERDLANAINAVAPQRIAQETRRIDSLLVHYSTDYVFDGNGERAWREDDEPAPINVYGQTKLAGEQAIQRSGCKHLIFRTSWVISPYGRNFVKTILQRAAEQTELRIVDDQVGAPTTAQLLAEATATALDRVSGDAQLQGLYHVCAAGESSWFEVARYALRVARDAGAALRIGPEDIKAVSSSEFKAAAHRPLNSRLDTTRYQQLFGVKLPDWKDGVQMTVKQILAGQA